MNNYNIYMDIMNNFTGTTIHNFDNVSTFTFKDYRTLQHEFMLNPEGSTLWETFCLIFPVCVEIQIASLITTTVFSMYSLTTKSRCIVSFAVDFLTIILPMICRITITDYYNPLHFFCIMLFLIFGIVYKFETLPAIKTTSMPLRFKPYITNARSSITVLSVIAILAVDFQIFPRRFAKTETYGYSLMDVGVGLFIFANGIVAPETRYRHHTVRKSIMDSFPLLALGGARFFVIKEAEYHVPVSEYGIHWNFFITLAVTKIVSSIILKIVQIEHTFASAAVLLYLHECLLQAGLSSWVFSNVPRDNFLAANREGIASSLGYIALHLLSVFIGYLLLLRNTSFDEFKRTGIKLFFQSIVFFIASYALAQTYGISRRLANSSYCLWVMFLGTFMCLLFLINDFINSRLYSKRFRTGHYVPFIYSAVSYNALTYFLLANILTGVINISIKTITVSSFNAFIIIVLYMIINCSIIAIMFSRKIKLL